MYGDNISDRALDHIASKLVNLKMKREDYKKNSTFNIEEYGADPLELVESLVLMYEYLYNLIKDDRKRDRNPS